MVDEPPCIVVFIRDITPRKTAERAIRAPNAELENRVAARTAELAQAEERLRLALEAGNIGVWQEFLPGRTLQGSDRFRAHLALPLGPAPSFEDFIDLVIPQLQQRGRYKTAYADGTLRETLFQADHPHLPADHPGSAYRFTSTPAPTGALHHA